jgi:hypothetical protein
MAWSLTITPISSARLARIAVWTRSSSAKERGIPGSRICPVIWSRVNPGADGLPPDATACMTRESKNRTDQIVPESHHHNIIFAEPAVLPRHDHIGIITRGHAGTLVILDTPADGERDDDHHAENDEEHFLVPPEHGQRISHGSIPS